MIKQKSNKWAEDPSVEQRTFKRVTGELQEMESTKQLVDLISDIYQPGMKVLDVGCAAGHYYNGLARIDSDLDYSGVDATIPYIEFAKNYFKDNKKLKVTKSILNFHRESVRPEIVEGL